MDKWMMVLFVILALIICYPLSSLLHEMGHILCGILNHWKLFMLVIGPVKIYRESLDGKLKLGLEKNVMMWGGVGGTLPQKESEDNLKIWGRILLAGPLFSIVVGLLLAILDVLLNGFSLFLGMFAWISMGMGVACIVPSKLKTGLLYNDGTRYRRLRRGGQEQAEEESLFKLVEIAALNPEVEKFPEDIIEPLLASKDNEIKYYGYYYRYYNAKQINDKAEMELQAANMEKIRDKTAKAVVDDCVL